MERRSRVFIVQEPMKWDRDAQAMVSVFNFNMAAQYGDLKVMLPGGQVALSTAPTIFKLKEQLRDFCDDDYIVPAGDPSAIAMAVAIASANNHGRFKLLKYDRDARAYIKVDVDIHRKLGEGQLTSGFEPQTQAV